MTVRINFLPRTYQPAKRFGITQWGVAAAVAVGVVAAGMYYSSVAVGTAQLTRDAQASQQKLQQVKAGLAQAAEIKVREDRVTRAESDLKSLTGRHWSSVLLDLRESTPQHVTWTSLKVNGNSMLLKGTNRGLVDVAQLFGSLVNNPEVARVNLHYVNEKGVPITITSKGAGDKSATEAGPAAKSASDKGATSGGANSPGAVTKGDANTGTAPNLPDGAVAPAGEYRQLEFEMEIILVAVEGGKPADGA